MSRFISTILLGIAVLAISTAIGVIGPKHIVGANAALPKSPIAAFELARTPTEVRAVIGDNGAVDPAKAVRAAFDRANRLDFLFMPTYAAFLASFFWAAWPSRGSAWLYPVCLIPVVAAGSDVFENRALFAMTAGGDPALSLGQLQVATWIKWFGLALATGLAGYVVAADRRHWPILRVLGGLGGAAAMTAALAAYFDRADFAGAMVDSIAGTWGVLTVYAVVEVIRARRAAAQALPR